MKDCNNIRWQIKEYGLEHTECNIHCDFASDNGNEIETVVLLHRMRQKYSCRFLNDYISAISRVHQQVIFWLILIKKKWFTEPVYCIHFHIATCCEVVSFCEM